MKRYTPTINFSWAQQNALYEAKCVTPDAVMAEYISGDYVRYEEACPKWTKSKPTVPGAYWLKGTDGQLELANVRRYPGVSELFADTRLGTYMLSDLNSELQFCGPLYNPEA